MSNRDEIERFRRELATLVGDISQIDKKVLNKSVNAGLRSAKYHTPVDTGFLRDSWAVSPTRQTADGVEKELFNTADYGLYVDAGHRVVNGSGETTGFVEGHHMMDKAIRVVEKAQVREFRKELERLGGQ